jgi:hypothetical protein
MPPPYFEVCQMQAWGSGAATPLHPPPYMFLMRFSWRSIQQMQEGTANIAYNTITIQARIQRAGPSISTTGK